MSIYELVCRANINGEPLDKFTLLLEALDICDNELSGDAFDTAFARIARRIDDRHIKLEETS